MAEPEAESITGGPTPEPPQEPSDIARKIEREAEHRPLPQKAKTAASELDREVSGEYEAKQERDAGKKRRR
ncbi:MAG: hypothetical protein E6I24_03335 [Chloroflexi bacterium]|nr:MAG: hypothetical protein E6I24_03335 [Chloroflexota bacterium]TMG15377.1 MAG: hypothetical protein E6I01_07475 [Chloroflexota bacterium]